MKQHRFLEANKIGLSVVIPCFQSELTLKDVVNGIQNTLKTHKINRFEIILVLDGPTDGTMKIAYQLEESFSKCRVVELSRNFGQHAAIYAGISISNYGLVVTMDDDGQHLSCELPKLIEAIDEQVDVVYGRPLEDEHGSFRNFASNTFKAGLFKILGVKNARDISALRIFRKELLQNIDFQKISAGIVDVPLHWNSTRIKTIPIKMAKRAKGKSNYTLRSLFGFAIQMVVSYSVKPLKFALGLGLFGFLASALLTIYFLIQYFTGKVQVAGFSTITVLITTISSIQLVTLGVLGEYVANIHQRSIGKPIFNIKQPSNTQF